jgi:hypothetical protein
MVELLVVPMLPIIQLRARVAPLRWGLIVIPMRVGVVPIEH